MKFYLQDTVSQRYVGKGPELKADLEDALSFGPASVLKVAHLFRDLPYVLQIVPVV